MIEPTITVDTRELNAAIREAAKNSSRTLAQILNRKLSFICNKAIQLTKKANKEDITNALENTQLGYALMELARKRTGKYKDLPNDQALRKFIKTRIRAINFIRMQWKWAVAALMPYVRQNIASVSVSGGSPKGGAMPAKSRGIGEVVAMGWNDVHGSGGDPNKVAQIVERGLQLAINAETISTWEHIADKEIQRKVCDVFNR